MKHMAGILATFAIIILLSGSVEAEELKIYSGKNFVEQKYVVPPRLRRPLLPPVRTPQKEYFPRQSFRPKPRYLPRVPKPTYDNRGGKRKNFGPPQTPRR